MLATSRTLRLTQIAAPLAVVLSAAYLAFVVGVEAKPWWQQAIGFLTGGSVGAIAGLGFFLLVGAVGWVSGPVFGAVGVLGLIVGGAIGGMGLGSVIDKLVDAYMNPGNFNFDAVTILSIMCVGLLAAWGLYVFLGRWLRSVEAGSTSAQDGAGGASFKKHPLSD